MAYRHIPNMVSINKIARPGKRMRFVQNQNSVQPIFAGSQLDSGVIPSQPSILPLKAGLGSIDAKDQVWMTTRV